MNLSQLLRDEEPFKLDSREGKLERRICDECFGASTHFVVYEKGKAVLKRCRSCYAVSATPSLSPTLQDAAIEAYSPRLAPN